MKQDLFPSDFTFLLNFCSRTDCGMSSFQMFFQFWDEKKKNLMEWDNMLQSKNIHLLEMKDLNRIEA